MTIPFAPPVQGGQQGSLLKTLGPLALKYGVNAAIPGGGFAADAAMAAGTSFLAGGGPIDPAEKDRVFADMIKAGMSPAAAKQIIDGVGYYKGIAHKNTGGPIGGGQTKQGLMEARQLGALTQAEFLKAMAHAGYKAGGGKVNMGPLAATRYKMMAEGGEVHEYEKKYHNPLAGGSSSGEK